MEREASPHGGRRPSTGGFQGREENLRWARQLFALSLVYLPVVTIALVVDLLWGAS